MRKFLVYWIIRFLLFCLCKIDKQDLKAIPKTGPLIVAGNHINFLDAPIGATYLYPRKITALVKKETFANPFFRFLFKTWGSIPVDRGTADFYALSQAVKALENGHFFAISPEGTRSRSGQLVQGHPGIVLVALRSNVPIIPMIQYGAEHFSHYFRRLRRTPITIKVGSPFLIKPSSPFPKKEERQQITDEIMYQMAQLLPAENRGYYADLSKATTKFLSFLPKESIAT